MRAVGIEILKDKPSEYVRLAATGEILLITDRDRVVAELVPPERTRADRLPDGLLADAVRRGLVTPAALPPGAPRLAPRVAPLREILEELDRDRSDSRSTSTPRRENRRAAGSGGDSSAPTLRSRVDGGALARGPSSRSRALSPTAPHARRVHLASIDDLRGQRLRVSLATYDESMARVAEEMSIPLEPLSDDPTGSVAAAADFDPRAPAASPEDWEVDD
jgi:antitoxin (DNA-binding transcriptional repressor) of toxin-antitoxin stability system